MSNVLKSLFEYHTKTGTLFNLSGFVANLQRLSPEELDKERIAKNNKKKVYFARSGNRIKIGVSNDCESRIETLKTGVPDLEYIGCCNGGYELETKLHKRFHKDNIGREWFWETNEVTNTIKELITHDENQN